MRVFVLDSTLHDGTGDERVRFSVDDKLAIAARLEEFGVDYIDGGWPALNGLDREFFKRARALKMQHGRLTAFGMIQKVKGSMDDDPAVQALADAATRAVCLSGESWDLHVFRTLGVTAEQHAGTIRAWVKHFKALGREVIYNAEHFFDAYNSHPEFALSTIEAAHEAGADVVTLCDTNGGTLTSCIAQVCAVVRLHISGTLGIHAHNDSDLAVANTIAAVEQGFTHVQGCMNGYGERCGCANLCSVIPNLELKEGHTTVGREKLEHINELAHFIAEIANLNVPEHRPYVGSGAFGHKNVMHLGTIIDEPFAADHIRPEYVGNSVKSLIDHLGEPGNLVWKVGQYRLPRKLSGQARRMLMEIIQQKEAEGYDLVSSEGTFELLLREAVHPGLHLFKVISYEALTRRSGDATSRTEASVSVEVNEDIFIGRATAGGPVHALDLALREALSSIYPSLGKVKLIDYRVRVLEAQRGTAANVRVLIDWTDGTSKWSTAGVSDNVVEASWLALADGMRLELLRFSDAHQIPPPTVEDYSWGV